MKTLMYLTLAAVSLFGSGLLAADNFYYEYSTSVSLTTTDDYVVVKQDDQGFTPLLDIIAGNPALSTTIHPSPVANGFVRLALNSGYSAAEVVAGLRQTTGILFANNLYRYGDSLRFYPTDFLYLHFKTTTSDADIDSIMQAYSLTQVATLYGDHYIRVAQTTRTTPLDVITTGNRLFESGLFVIARASFCLPFQKFSSPNDRYYSYQWNLRNDGTYGTAGADIHFEEALQYTIPSTPWWLASSMTALKAIPISRQGALSEGGTTTMVVPISDREHTKTTGWPVWVFWELPQTTTKELPA